MQTGTIIQGTHKAEDLLPAFFRALEELAPLTAHIRRTGTYKEEIEHALNGTLADYLENETDETITIRGTAYPVDSREDRLEYVAGALEAIQEDLEANAPEGTYFGTLEGDGADFGFWPTDTEERDYAAHLEYVKAAEKIAADHSAAMAEEPEARAYEAQCREAGEDVAAAPEEEAYVIIATTPTYGEEEVDYAATEEEAEYLASEYRLAYGPTIPVTYRRNQ